MKSYRKFIDVLPGCINGLLPLQYKYKSIYRIAWKFNMEFNFMVLWLVVTLQSINLFYECSILAAVFFICDKECRCSSQLFRIWLRRNCINV